MRLPHISIAKKGMLVLLLPLLYQAMLVGVLLHRQRQQEEAQSFVLHSKEVLTQVGRLDRATLALQASHRGYALTALPVFETEVRDVLTALPALNARLAEVTRDLSIEQQGRVRHMREIVEKRVQFEREVLATMQSGDWPRAMERIRSLEGKKLMDALGREVDLFEQAAEREDVARLAQLHESTRNQDRLLLSGLLLNLGLGVAAALWFLHNITRRLDLLAANARRFALGETLVPLRGTPDELTELDNSFHHFATDLAEARRRERHAQHSAERRASELERVNRDLDHKNSENEMFVYSVSHDLRSPLVNLQGFSKELGLARDDLRELFKQEWTERAKARAQKLIERDVSESIHYIQTAVMRLSAIIDALLRLSRAGRVDYQPEMVDLAVIIERVSTALAGSLRAKEARFTLGPLPQVWADPTAIEQVFANLLTNAVNYLDPARPGEIEVGVCAELPAAAGGLPTYFVKDNGLGIAEAYLPKVFAIFQRLHAHAAQGEGVGLTLVKRMVERHGGRIWVESQAGVGSTFYVSLPPRAESPLIVAPKKESIRVTGATTRATP